MRLSKYFNLEEFASPDANYFPIDVLANIDILHRNLFTLRVFLGEPIHINSGWRTPAHNEHVGGVSNSQHVLGKAADIRVDGMSPKEVCDTIENMIGYGVLEQGGLGLYNTFVHYDIRGTKARWDYSKKDKA